MPRYKLTVAYDGTDFHGWQKQHPPGAEPLRTAQGVLEDVIREVVREPDLNLTGASRTDSGVHAEGQVAAFSCTLDIDPQRMSMALNSRLPADMQVVTVEIVPETFGPITDCIAKGYRYRLAHGCKMGVLRPLFDRHTTAWTSYDLDAASMNEAARHLVGEHDFASFTRLHHGRESTVRTVHSCEVRAPEPRRVVIDVSGNGFLYNMVRIIAGTLLDVGRGKFAPDDVPRILAARDRAAAGPTLPPEGLCLMWVRYG
jgi:tRNA pseudouridine38-40 synthase